MPNKQEHIVRYRILNPLEGNPEHAISVHASPAEIVSLIDDGYVVRHGWFAAEQLAVLAVLLDAIAAEEVDRPDPRVQGYGGWQYLRSLEKRNEAFKTVAQFEPLVSIAHAVLGPLIRVGEVVGKYGHARVAGQFVPWHIHMRLVTDPPPPFFSYPHGVDVFLNLDPIDAENGAFCVLPGSHRFTRRIYEQDDTSDLPGQTVLSLPAGSCVVMHANLWHRTCRSTANAELRRVLLFGYTPAWVDIEERDDDPKRPVAAKPRSLSDQTTLDAISKFYA